MVEIWKTAQRWVLVVDHGVVGLQYMIGWIEKERPRPKHLELAVVKKVDGIRRPILHLHLLSSHIEGAA